MTEQQATTIHIGSIVRQCGVRCKVLSVRLEGIAAPYFRMMSVEECTPAAEKAITGLTSYKLCDVV